MSQALNIPAENIVVSPDMKIEHKSFAALWVTTHPMENPKAQTKEDKTTWSSDGFRFGLYMSAVFLGILPSDQQREKAYKQFALKY